jgi:hypothetical protein
MVTKRRKPANGAAVPGADTATFAPVLNAGFQATTSRVQEMHQAIFAKTFDRLLQVPGLSVPTRVVQGLHDAIAQGVYAAVRQGGGAALSLAGQAERIAADPARMPGAREQAARSALNGVFGDRLSDSKSGLAIRMGPYASGAPVAVTPDGLRLASARLRVHSRFAATRGVNRPGPAGCLSVRRCSTARCWHVNWASARSTCATTPAWLSTTTRSNSTSC